MSAPTPGRMHALLGDQRLVTGCWSTLSDTLVAEVVAAAGFDAVIIDMQHGAHVVGTPSRPSSRASNSAGRTPSCG